LDEWGVGAGPTMCGCMCDVIALTAAVGTHS
jgi:hypothetical protein